MFYTIILFAKRLSCEWDWQFPQVRPASVNKQVPFRRCLAYLPKMHERYFFLGEISDIVFGFAYRKYWFLSFLVAFASITSYYLSY